MTIMAGVTCSRILFTCSAAVGEEAGSVLAPQSDRFGAKKGERPAVAAISSPSNPFVKHCIKLRMSSSYRHSCGSALVIGHIPISEITRFQESKGRPGRWRSDSLIECLLLLEGAEETRLDLCEPSSSFSSLIDTKVVRVSSAVMKKLSGLKSVETTDAAAVMRIPKTFCDLNNAEKKDEFNATWVRRFFASSPPHRVLVLDGVQDPGNIGTLLRSATAFKWDAVFLLPGCCDPFNEKALRSARGASFQLPIVCGNWSHLKSLAETFHMKLLAAHPNGDGSSDNSGSEAAHLSKTPYTSSPISQQLVDALAGTPLCLVLGSEGQGLSVESRDACGLLVSIPMAGEFESLNVAVAGGIMLYMLQGQSL